MNTRQRRDLDHLKGRHENAPDADCFGCFYTAKEAYQMVASEMYVENEVGYETPDAVLATLEPVIVVEAQRYAKANDLQWPPAPDGLCILITSL